MMPLCWSSKEDTSEVAVMLERSRRFSQASERFWKVRIKDFQGNKF